MTQEFTSIFHEETLVHESELNNKVNVNMQVPSDRLNQVRAFANKMNKAAEVEAKHEEEKDRNRSNHIANVSAKKESYQGGMI